MMTVVKNYIRSRMKVLNYTEWTDPFDSANMPKTRAETLFRIEMGEARAERKHDCYVISCPGELQIVRNPARDAVQVVDDADVAGENAVKDLVASINCLNYGNGLKTFEFERMKVERFTKSNHNGAVVKINFKALVVIATRP